MDNNYCIVDGWKRLKEQGFDELTSYKIAQDVYREVKDIERIRLAGSACGCQESTVPK
jgi:hypothetical protein